jgi:hypothetical protein
MANVSTCPPPPPHSLSCMSPPERLEMGVEIEANGDSMRTYERWIVRSALCAGTRYFCHVLAALVGSVQNIFPHHTLQYFTSSAPPPPPITQQARQAVVPPRLSINTVSVSGLLSDPLILVLFFES